MAWSLVSHSFGQSTDTNTVTSATLNSTGATQLFAVLSINAASGAGVGVSDSKSNTWVLDKTVADGVTRVIQIYRCSNPISVGTLHTVSSTGTTGMFPSIGFLTYSGCLLSNPLDQSNGASGTGTTLQPGNVTPSDINELVITGVCGAGTPTISGGYILVDSAVNTGTSNMVGTAYQIQTVATATNPTWSGLLAVADSSAIVTYRLSQTTGNMLLAF